MAALSFRRLLVLAGVLIVTAVALEAGTRLYDRARGRPWDAARSAAATRAWCDDLVLEMSASPGAGRQGNVSGEERILQPYTAWELASTQMRIARDAEEYRRAGDTAFDVYVLGGASALTLAETLARDPRLRGREVRVHDYACRGYKQPQMSKLLAWLLTLGHRPDAVIEVDGVDEAALGWENARAGTHPSYPSVEYWSAAAGGMRSDWQMVERFHELRQKRGRALAFGEWILAAGLSKSCFLDHLASIRLRKLDRERLAAAQRLEDYVRDRPENPELRGPAFPAEEPAVDDEIVACWERASKSMSGMCSVRGIPFVLVLQTASPEQVAAADRLRPGLREAGKRLAASGTRFLEAPDTAFADRVAGALIEAAKF